MMGIDVIQKLFRCGRNGRTVWSDIVGSATVFRARKPGKDEDRHQDEHGDQCKESQVQAWLLAFSGAFSGPG
jgi:hypothetical protein